MVLPTWGPCDFGVSNLFFFKVGFCLLRRRGEIKTIRKIKERKCGAKERRKIRRILRLFPSKIEGSFVVCFC